MVVVLVAASALLLMSSTQKLARPSGLTVTLRELEVPFPAVSAVAFTVFEFVVALGVLAFPPPVAAAGVLVLGTAIAAAGAVALVPDVRVSCSCFGASAPSLKLGWKQLWLAPLWPTLAWVVIRNGDMSHAGRAVGLTVAVSTAICVTAVRLRYTRCIKLC